MDLPKIRSIRETDVKIGTKSFKIRPWSNRDVLRFESALDSAGDDVSVEQRKQLVYDYLLKPNIIEQTRDLTIIEREVIYIEMYKISKGVLIPLKYKCPVETCGHVTEINFNISKNFTFHDMGAKEIQTDDVKFMLKSSNYVPEEGDDPTRYYASFIREIEYKGQKYIAELDDIVNWLLDDLDEVNFEQFISKMIEVLPWIELKMTCECELCGHKDEYRFTELPDF